MLLEDGAFNRRFHRIDVAEPKIDMLKSIIYARAQEYATFHNCAYEKEAVHAAIAHSYSLPGHYPDKTLALLDRAGGLVMLQQTTDFSPSQDRYCPSDRSVTRDNIMQVVEDVQKTMTHR